MHYIYKTTSCCAKEIEFNIENDKVTDIKFKGGCPGNLRMLSKLLNNKTKEEIISLCKENPCPGKTTSCMDQLSKALETIKESN